MEKNPFQFFCGGHIQAVKKKKEDRNEPIKKWITK